MIERPRPAELSPVRQTEQYSMDNSVLPEEGTPHVTPKQRFRERKRPHLKFQARSGLKLINNSKAGNLLIAKSLEKRKDQDIKPAAKAFNQLSRTPSRFFMFAILAHC
jgi:hypothetical protein